MGRSVAGWLGGSGVRSDRGLSLIEVSVILSVIALIAGISAPSVNMYVDMARQTRAREDVERIATAIIAFITDGGETMFLRNGSDGTLDWDPPTRNDSNRVELLVSDGDIPTLGSGVSTESFWTRAVDSAAVDTMSNHLIENLPGETVAKRYRNGTDITNPTRGSTIDFVRNEHSGLNSPYAWRGAYVRSRVEPDPWGNRYAVNAAFLDPRVETGASTLSNITAGFVAADYIRLDSFVLSAGPDEEIDTKSAQDGAVPGDDDFIYLVLSNANKNKS